MILVNHSICNLSNILLIKHGNLRYYYTMEQTEESDKSPLKVGYKENKVGGVVLSYKVLHDTRSVVLLCLAGIVLCPINQLLHTYISHLVRYNREF